ncbi:peptidase [Bordetella trematum]|uniref:Microcystinase C n=2 Tax=Bordetella trematum TaxID=123899 RepID=A0A157RDW3_9BORD|nr:M81 family metallopeptidase [Bordetella trematum]SAI55519.1 peptidase [Bordetella trematum]SAI68810.1 peptidase [Bordetella trematum]SUV99599.1 peptidase [Bordetella trematum]
MTPLSSPMPPVSSCGARRKRLAVARFWFEGNAFTPIPCTLADFQRQEWGEGAQVLAAARETASEMGAVEQFARQHPDWDVTVLRCAAAQPGGPIEDAAFEAIRADILAGLQAGQQQAPWDAIYLSLHGAAITDARQNPELELLQAVRALAPHTPLGASFDLHGNLGPEIAPLLDAAAAYKTYPHIDQFDTASRVLDLLAANVQHGARTRVWLDKPGLLLSSFNMRTQAGPMCELQHLARTLTQGPIRDISVFGGFPYSDTVNTGASVVITADDDATGEAAARQALATLSQALRQAAPEFAISLPSATQGLAQALALLAQGPGLIAVNDPGDNPASGGSGDTTTLLRAVLDTPFDEPCVVASFADPQAMRAVEQAGPGAELTLSLGGRYNRAFGEPVTVQVRIERLTDGDFTNVGPKETGVLMRCGPTALLSLVARPNIRVILTEHVVPANDPGFFLMHGIDPVRQRLLCVKAKNHFRAAFGSLCRAIIDIDAPGPAALDLSLLPFRHARAQAV